MSEGSPPEQSRGLADAFRLAGPGDLLPFVAPLIAGFAIVTFVVDPVFRFPLLVFTLPLYMRGSAAILGIYDTRIKGSRGERILGLFSFSGVVMGWTLMFALAVLFVVNLAGFQLTNDIMKQAILIGAVGFIVVGWFWWPYYVKQVLSAWPEKTGRIFVETANRWDVLLRSYQLQRMPEIESSRWRGFVAVSILVVVMMALSSLGVFPGVVSTLLELIGVASLPFLHLVIVRDANHMCQVWRGLNRTDVDGGNGSG